VKGAEIFDLSGRVAIVTGGSIGLGRQMAEGLAKMCANLVLCGRKKERCEQAAAELEKCGVRALGLACDVKDPGSIQAVVDATVSEFDRIDVRINNAGTSWGAPTEKMTFEQRRRTPDPTVDELVRKWAKEVDILQRNIFGGNRGSLPVRTH
jgi:NAD(P)-dependent dehydrogenase (short-subunit alcohol dehydrogenase family)